MISTVNMLSEFWGKYNPNSIDEYIKLGGFNALEKILKIDKNKTIDSIKTSGLRGRGGAAYPTGLKLEQSAAVTGERKIVICNADEGEPGTFKDRIFLELDPFKIIEGMIISAFLIGGTEGYIYIREEYSHIHSISINAIKMCREKGYLGKNILGSGLDFDIKFFSGAGAYVCGEGGALIESIEGNQGKPRRKPPYTKQKGLWQLPTLVINVETLAAIPTVINHGPVFYASMGCADSRGTKIISLSGKINNPGAYEVPFGVTINDIINDLGGGMKNGSSLNFIQLGGASGPIIPSDKLDLKLCYVELCEYGFDIGSGAIVVADKSIRLIDYLYTVYEFFKDESCGKCTPCREGNGQILYLLHKICEGRGKQADLDLAIRFAKHMKESSFCGLGKTAPTPLLTAVEYMGDQILI